MVLVECISYKRGEANLGFWLWWRHWCRGTAISGKSPDFLIFVCVQLEF